MEKYHKINGLYKRFTEGPLKGQFKDGRDGKDPEFSTNEFKYLFDNIWIGTEKIDGTNIRIHWDSDTATFQYNGRTDKAEIPFFLDARIQEIIDEIEPYCKERFPTTSVTFFGEGYGSKIQKVGKNYIPDGVDFILFDIKIGRWWLKREDVDSIAEDMCIHSVPVVFRGTLKNAIEYVKKGFFSVEARVNPTRAEGLVLIPEGDFLDRSGNRIITKLKTKDFQLMFLETIEECLEQGTNEKDENTVYFYREFPSVPLGIHGNTTPNT